MNPVQVGFVVPLTRSFDGVLGVFDHLQPGANPAGREERLAMKRDLLRREGVTLAASNR